MPTIGNLDALTVEAPGVKKALVSLPRGRRRDPDTGEPEDPVVELDLELAKRAAGCAICDKVITPNTTRIVIRMWLKKPRPISENRRQLTEKYYLHVGCLTNRVKPEVIRTRMDCYDCGAVPEQTDGPGYVHWDHRCFTVSKFAHSPLCTSCTQKKHWLQCGSCLVWYPHHMLDRPAVDKKTLHEGQWVGVNLLCEFCSHRHKVPLEREQAQAQAEFEKLQQEIRENGIFG